jgi:hypothetical protein
MSSNQIKRHYASTVDLAKKQSTVHFASIRGMDSDFSSEEDDDEVISTNKSCIRESTVRDRNS